MAFRSDIQAKLQQQLKKTYYKIEAEKYEVGNDIRIGKEGGMFYEHFTTIRYAEGRRGVLQYNGKFPNLREPLDLNNTKFDLVSDEVLNIIEDAVDSYLKYKHYHLNAYDFLVTYCLVKGVDLVECLILEV